MPFNLSANPGCLYFGSITNTNAPLEYVAFSLNFGKYEQFLLRNFTSI